MKYIALNLFLGSHPRGAAMLVRCGCPCIYIKIVRKTSHLFMPWVCKLNLLSASCRQSIEVCLRLSLQLSGSWFHTMALCWWQGSNPSPFPWADRVPCAFGFLTQAMAEKTRMKYLLYHLGESCLFASSTLRVTPQPVLKLCSNRQHVYFALFSCWSWKERHLAFGKAPRKIWIK